ncbi:MAG: hypothetical protein ACI8YQ_004203 [Polaribacter sp.]|jgi:hypothetical protein
MAGYKVVGKKGFLLELSAGAHRIHLLKGKVFDRGSNTGGIVRLMIGYQINWKKP